MADLTPTEAMASAARRGLRLHDEGKSGDGLKPETVRRANIIAERQELSEEHVREMAAWFPRHEASKTPGWDDPGEETPGFVAWLLWGGDPARAWSERKVAELDREQDRSSAMEGNIIERRDVAFETDDEIVVEERADGRAVIKGYAVVYNRLSVDLGGFRERIMPGAFDAVLTRQRGRADLVSYYNHNPDMLLGRESSGTLKVWSDQKGVGFEVTPPATRADVLELVRRLDVKGASFTFSLNGSSGESWATDESGRAIREIRAATIYELGPVVQPAYPSTSVSVAMRSYQAWLASQGTPEATPHVVGPDIVAASMRLRAARLRSFMRGKAR